MKIVVLSCMICNFYFAGDRLPVTITPRDGSITTKPAPVDSSAIPATLIAQCGDIRAILGPQGKNIAVCRHGDVMATIIGAPTGSSTDPMAVKIAYSTNYGATWTTYGPFTGNCRRIYGGVYATPDFCTNPGEVFFCWMKGVNGYAPFPLEVVVEENLPSAPSPSAPINVTWSDSLYPWQTGICMAPDNPGYILTHAWSYLSQGDNHLYSWISSDGGYTWDMPVDMGVIIDPTYGGNCGAKLRMGTGGYAAGIYINSVGGITNDGWPHFIESTDGGQNWLPPVTLPVPHFDSAAGMFWWHEIEAEVVNNEPWLIANDIGGGGFWLYRGNGSPGNWTWTNWDLGVIGACSTWVGDTLFQLIPGQYGSLCYDPVSGVILCTYKGVAFILQGGSNVLCNGPVVNGCYTYDEGASWHIVRPLSAWNTMTYSDWNATETAHRLVNESGRFSTYTVWIHNTNFNLYFERGFHGIEEKNSYNILSNTLHIYPTICSQRCQMQFELIAGDNVSVKLYDRTGRLVENLLDRRMSAGKHELTVNINGYPAGVYFVTLESSGLRQTAKVIINR